MAYFSTSCGYATQFFWFMRQHIVRQKEELIERRGTIPALLLESESHASADLESRGSAKGLDRAYQDRTETGTGA